MYGNHDHETAVRIAAEKSKETGEPHIVFPAIDEPDLFTVGVPIKGLTGSQFVDKFKNLLGRAGDLSK